MASATNAINSGVSIFLCHLLLQNALLVQSVAFLRHFIVGEVVFVDFEGGEPFVVFYSVISFDNLAFSFVMQSNSSLDRAQTLVLVVASIVPGIDKGVSNAVIII